MDEDLSKARILVVDDEKMVLTALERILKVSLHCEVLTANSGIEALRILGKQKCDAVISDMCMPGMDGVQLLNTIQELYPDTIRLMFSARNDSASALRAVGATHQYFLKPTNVSVLSERIATMLRFRRLLPKEGIEDVISRIGALPSIPGVYREMDAELQKPDVSNKAIGLILEKDLSMSAKVLQLVNSAFFGLRETVTSPSQAVNLLGLNTVRSLFLGIHIFGEWKETNVCGISPQNLWTHSTSVASAAMEIATHMGIKTEKAGEVFCAGLFHDLGKLLISSNLSETSEQIHNLCKTGTPLCEAERKILGASHAEIGGYLLALWGFPMNIIKAIAFHHNPSASGEKTFSAVAAVHFADCCRREGLKDVRPLTPNISYLTEIGLGDAAKHWETLING